MNTPDQNRYTKTHEWVRQDKDGAVVGISDFAQRQVTDVVYVDLPKVGKEVKAGDEVMVIESVKAAFSIYAPISGKVSRVNEELRKDPSLVNKSPYDKGWLFALAASNPKELDTLMDAASYAQHTAQEEAAH